MKSEFKTIEVFEQAGTYDGKYKLTVAPSLLMKVINHGAAECGEEIKDMDSPVRLAVKVTIETREIPTQK